MIRQPHILAIFLVAPWAIFNNPANAQTAEATQVDAATSVLNEIMAIPASSIPTSMLAGAQGVAIIPNVIKGGFVIGVRHGRGVVVTRDANGGWAPPTFVTLTGGSVGWQAGVQSTDVILVFKTRKSIQNLLSGKFTIGADAAAAAGPVGRQAAAATDAQLRAEILSYSRSRGLFAGVSLDGSVIQVDGVANNNYYRGTGIGLGGVATGQPVQWPPSAIKLVETLSAYTKGNPAQQGQPVAGGAAPAAVQMNAAAPQSVAGIVRHLAQSSQTLSLILDANWRQYLALPPEVFNGQTVLNVESLKQALSRFDLVAQTPQYQTLAQRVEFRTTHQALGQLVSVLSGNPATLSLPAPPGAQTGTNPVNPRY